MSYGNYSTKTEGGSGGRRGHSNMNHREGTETIKRHAKKARRQSDRELMRRVLSSEDLELE